MLIKAGSLEDAKAQFDIFHTCKIKKVSTLDYTQSQTLRKSLFELLDCVDGLQDRDMRTAVLSALKIKIDSLIGE